MIRLRGSVEERADLASKFRQPVESQVFPDPVSRAISPPMPDQQGGLEGIYFPNRNSNLCSRKYCNFADACCKEFGGCVE